MGPADKVRYQLAAPSGSIGLNVRPNPWQYVLTGAPGSSATLTCFLPIGPADLCRGLRVTVQ
jgi:hypothetical protein